MAWEMARCWHSTVSIDRQAKDRAQAREWASVKMKTLRGQETAGGRGRGGGMTGRNARMPKRGKNCQSSHRHSPSGEEKQRVGVRGWPRQHKVMWKKDPPFSTHPPTHPSIHPCAAHHSATLNILGRQNIWKLFRKKEKKRIGVQRTVSMRRWWETVKVCLGITGLRGAFSHRVVSEACSVLRPLWLTVFILWMRSSDTHTRMCIALLMCYSVLCLVAPRQARKCVVWFIG